jgi:Rod binding domain-containing protein
MNEIGPLRSFDSPRQPDSPAKVHDAAQQFEALLIGQILKSVRESAGSSSDPSADSAMGYAEEQLAAVLAHNGGLGLSTVIEAGLKREA